MGQIITVALGGNPNCGKTTVFNALTGLRHKVANYPGVTVERRSGSATAPGGEKLAILDLPGVYSLADRSPDEEVAVSVVVGSMPDEARPDVIVNVCDATNLERNLYLTTQLLELGLPVVVALTMIDVARRRDGLPDADRLSEALGVPVVLLDPADPGRWEALKRVAVEAVGSGPPTPVVELPGALAAAVKNLNGTRPFGAVLRELSAVADAGTPRKGTSEAIVAAARRLDVEVEDWWKAEPVARYRWIDAVVPAVLARAPGKSRSEGIDRIALHPLLGPVTFVVIMGLCFQAVFSWASVPMDLLGELFGAGSAMVGSWIGPGILRDLVVDGVLAGVLNVLIFLPQIAILFLILGFLEDSGYLARATFIMDEPMRRVGLHGRSFVPMLSSFACAIPGIMGTRTISHPGARLVTILVAPLMSCSARLPVYTLVIGAFFADSTLFGGAVSTAAVVMLAAYLLGIVTAAAVAFVLRKTVIRGEAPTLIMELPPYRRPRPLPVLRNVFDRGVLFVKKAWTVILLFTILLWFLQNFPRDEAVLERIARADDRLAILEERGEAADAAEIEELETARNAARRDILADSLAGRIGHGMEPVLEPIGLDWQMGIGILASFAAREVLVSTLAQVYAVDDDDDGIAVLTHRLRELEDPATGKPRYTPLAGLSLLVFFVLACQCMSTIAVVRRETASWRWPLFMFTYMTVLAWMASFLTWQIGCALGYGP